MTRNDLNHRENGVRKLGDPTGASADRQSGGQPQAPQTDVPHHDAVREASRLGASDNYLVDQDMEDLDQREGQDGPDGRPSPLANADNPER